MPILKEVVEYRFVTPEVIARGITDDGRAVQAVHLPRHVEDARATRQEQLVEALEIEVETHRDCGVALTEIWHSNILSFFECNCRDRLARAKTYTRTAARHVLAKVWIVGGPPD